MLQPILESLNGMRLVLASTSPRRKMLLENVGLKFEVVPSTFEENLDKATFNSPLGYVQETAKQKTLDVVHRLYGSKDPPPDLIIGADTIVTKDDEIFEKPRDRQHAIEVLTRFSGKPHTVYTSVVLATPNKEGCGDGPPYNLVQFEEGTEVYMAELSQRVIEAYVDTGECMDKAGGYGIQALGSTLIEGVKGDYFNVIGFPLHPFAKHLLKIFPPS